MATSPSASSSSASSASGLHVPRALRQHVVQNPFPGLARLEATLGHPITHSLASNEALRLEGGELAAALVHALGELSRRYPDPSATALRNRLSTGLGVEPESLLVDAGADSLILLLLRSVTDAGMKVVVSAGTYPTFKYFAEGLGLDVIEVPYLDRAGARTVDLQALVRAAHEHGAAVAYLADPDNPTGTSFAEDDLLALAGQLPSSCLLMLDEAYADFTDIPRGARLAPNVARLRSFSKGHGLAGLRIGYALVDTGLAAVANQLRIHYAVSSLAQAAALHLIDTPFPAALRRETLSLREDMARTFTAQGLDVFPSMTNFVAIRCRTPAIAAEVQARLWTLQVAVHRPAHPAMSDLLRITAHPRALAPEVLDVLRLASTGSDPV